MANTLGLDDDMDGVELVIDIEKAFGLKIENREAEVLLCVGDLYDLLLQKIPANEADRKCAGAMTFYRLRRALEDFGAAKKLPPSADLAFLMRRRPASNFKRLERESGLRLPALELSAAGGIGCLVSLAASAVIIGLGIAGIIDMPAWSFIGAIVTGVAFLYFDPGRIPEKCRTLAGLVENTAPLNFGRLVKQGASHRPQDIWSAMVKVLCVRFWLPETEVTCETFFLQSQLDRACKKAA